MMYERLMRAKSATGQAHFKQSPDEVVQVNIRPDKSISPAKFKADPLLPGGYLAHPTTIRAVRVDIFVGGQEVFEDLEYNIECEGCKRQIDVQFWKFCPYCEAKFPSPLPPPIQM